MTFRSLPARLLFKPCQPNFWKFCNIRNTQPTTVMKNKIKSYIEAGYAGLFLLSPEERRIETEVQAAASELGFALHAWSGASGMVDLSNETVSNCPDPLDALERISELGEKSLILLRDFQMFLEDANPVLVRKLREVLAESREQGRVVVLCGCRHNLPPELEHEITVVEFALPDKEALGSVIDGIARSADLSLPEGEERERLVCAASGLTTMEAENACALSVVETGSILPEVLVREKAAVLKKGGLLEIVPVEETLDRVGGLDLLKDWLGKRVNAFGTDARAYGLPSPKGILITGIPGTGKSLTAKATASVFRLPLLRLDVGRIFAGLVGQTESNLRAVIRTAEAMAPCVLMVDEIEKGMAGAQSSGSTDGGTSARMLGGFLSWMQDKTAPVFVVATANDVSQLPPEMLRKGRFDNLFFVDLPHEAERRAIWAIQIARHRRNPEHFNLRTLAKSSEGMTGSEIEQAFIEALYQAFTDGREPDDATVQNILAATVPLSTTMAERIQTLRQWAQTRAQPATATPNPSTRPRRVAPAGGRN